jgi:hypothetical protein
LKPTAQRIAGVRLKVNEQQTYENKNKPYLWHLNDIKKEYEQLTLVLQVDCPCNERPVVWGCPCVSRKMKFSWVFLNIFREWGYPKR